jgi:hypothetical protein
MKPNPSLAPLERALGTWAVTGAHPYLPGRTLRGRVTLERIEGGAFIRMCSKMEDAEIPEGVALFGTDGDAGTCTMLYFDARGVSRRYELTFDADGFTWSRDAAPLAQRFRVTIAPDGQTMKGEGRMKKDDGDWEADLSLAYVREA